MKEVVSISLLEIIDPELTKKPFFCDPVNYRIWEDLVAIPTLKEQGYVVGNQGFHTREGDSFGPLSRGIFISSDKTHYLAWYG